MKPKLQVGQIQKIKGSLKRFEQLTPRPTREAIAFFRKELEDLARVRTSKPEVIVEVRCKECNKPVLKHGYQVKAAQKAQRGVFCSPHCRTVYSLKAMRTTSKLKKTGFFIDYPSEQV